jgi:hypothetical protein
VPNPHAPDNRPDLGKKIADTANRAGVADRLPALAVPKHLAVDLALSTADDTLLSGLELQSRNTAKQHDAQPRSLWPTVPGMGNILSRVRRSESHDLDRAPRGQDCVSDGRRVRCAQESAGTRLGPAGQNIGNAHLTGAFSEAAALFRRHHDPGQTSLTRVENRHATGKALTLLAPQLARAGYDRLTRKTAVDRHRCLQTDGSRAGAPGASLAT